MGNKGKVSVIVPVYNAEKTLRRCVDSLLRQSYSDFELLLIDDGSIDSSPFICDEYARQDIRVRSIHQINSGPSAARNKGIDEAQGCWIIFVDSDDYVSHDYLAVLIKLGCNDTVVIQGVNILRKDKKIVKNTFSEKQYNYNEYGKMIADQAILECGYPFAKLFPAKVLIMYRIRFDDKIRRSEDLLFLMKVLERIPKVRLNSSCNYYYDTTHSQLSTAKFSYESESRLYEKLSQIFDANIVQWRECSFIILPYLGRILTQRLVAAYFSSDILPRRKRVHLLYEMKSSGRVSLKSYHSSILLIKLIKCVATSFPVFLSDSILLLARFIYNIKY